MDKWDYIRAIAEESYERVMELLRETGHRSTLAVTLDEAREFYEKTRSAQDGKAAGKN